MITISGGLSTAANSTLPGDLLHPIKVNINERVKAILASGTENEADLALELMNERLSETELLVQNSDLKTEVVAQVEARFDEQAAKLRALIEKAQAEGKTEVAAKLSANLNAMLQVHDQVIAQLREKLAGVDPTNIENVQAKIKAEIKNADDISVRIETKVKADESNATSTPPIVKPRVVEEAARAKLAAVQSKIDEAARFIENKKSSVSAEAAARAEAKLAEARALVIQGQAKLEAGAFGEAFVLFQKAHVTAQSAKLQLEVSKRLKIEINDDKDEVRRGNSK